MRYVVCGAGAIGGVVGARLFEQSLDVVLIARGDHFNAIRRNGLVIQSPQGSATLRIPVVGDASEIAYRDGDVVLLATKTQDSAAALDTLHTAAGSNTPIVCLQNGVESARLASRRFARVAGAMVMLPSVFLQAGIVQAFSAPVTGIVDLGRFPNGKDLLWSSVSSDLRRAGFESEVRDDILRWQYSKLLNNLKNVLQALCGPDADYAELFAGVRAEAEACYRAAGIGYVGADELLSRTRGVLKLGEIDGLPRPGDSSWQSLARSTGSIETDYLNGEITLLGRLHNVPTPLNARLQDLANRRALDRRAPGDLSVDELRHLLHCTNE